MSKRDIITIDESLCNGCGVCVEGCHEGALQMINGKARIISELYCDGLGACIGDCPVGAISIESREAEAYDECAVISRIALKGETTIIAHLNHLKSHNEQGYLDQAISYLDENNFNLDLQNFTAPVKEQNMPCGCPGTMARSFVVPSLSSNNKSQSSQLTQWPVQLHLINPNAGYFSGADVLLAADCVAYAYGDFHNTMLRGKRLAIACPKLDSNKESYIEKLTEMIDYSQIKSLTVAIMEVPCCRALLQIAKSATERTHREIAVKHIVVGRQGDIVNNI